jgi:hypothetical protein
VKIIEEPQLEVKSKVPWFIDVLLYPANFHGIIQIAIIFLLTFLLGILDRYVLARLPGLGGLLSLGLRALLFGYIFYYFGYCIFDSSKGTRRAPAIPVQHTPDKAQLIWQLVLILGSAAICFWPTAVYYIFLRQPDLIFWLLVGCGVFLFPMALLAGMLFDAFDALNPLLIIGSIRRTLLPYCGLILSFCVLAGLVTAVIFILRRFPILNFASKPVNLYLLFVAGHLLGRFYWWNKDKLDWGL